MGCPDYAYELSGMRVLTADEELSEDQLCLRLATGRFRADPLGLEWTASLLGGDERSGRLDEEAVADLQELVAVARERVRQEGPTMLARDLKAELRLLVDRSIADALAS